MLIYHLVQCVLVPQSERLRDMSTYLQKKSWSFKFYKVYKPTITISIFVGLNLHSCATPSIIVYIYIYQLTKWVYRPVVARGITLYACITIPNCHPRWRTEALGWIVPDARGLRGRHHIGDGDAGRAQVVVDPLGDLGSHGDMMRSGTYINKPIWPCTRKAYLEYLIYI